MNDRKRYEKREVYPGIYLLKAICAFFVVATHVPQYGAGYFQPLICIAVPCFYMVTGFFLFSGDSTVERRQACKWAKKAFLLLIITSTFYLYWNDKDIFALSPGEILRVFCQGGIIAPHLWYLSAMWEALLIFCVIRKLCSDNVLEKMLYLSIPLILGSLLMQRYHFLISMWVGYSQWFYQSFITVAIPCMSIGYLIGKYKNKLLNGSFWYILGGAFFLLSFIEAFLLNRYVGLRGSGYCLNSLPAAACMVIACLQSDVKASNIGVVIGKRYSADIYYWHMFIAGALGSVIAAIPGGYAVQFTAVFAFVGSIFFSMLLLWGKRSMINIFRKMRARRVSES